MCLEKTLTLAQSKKIIKLQHKKQMYYSFNKCNELQYNYIINNVFKVAKKDITIYKLLNLKNKKGKIIYYSPYRGTKYELNNHYYQTKQKFTIDIANIGMPSSKFIMVNRGLHSYTDYDFSRLRDSSIANACYVKAIIPKGSLYLRGDSETEIVSDNLILTDDIVALLFID
jgi:hypothetical protein